MSKLGNICLRQTLIWGSGEQERAESLIRRVNFSSSFSFASDHFRRIDFALNEIFDAL
jgi:hypothetical protein